MKKLATLLILSLLSIQHSYSQCIVDLGPDRMICANAPIMLDAGPGFVSYLWSTGATGQTTMVFGPGTYGVSVINAQSDTCSDSVFLFMAAPLSISLDCFGTSCDTCTDGSVYATVFGGFPSYSYSWSTGSFAPFLTGVGQGTYTLSVVDGNGCSASESCDVLIGNLGTGPFEISGNIYFDIDSNGTKDIAEGGISYTKIMLAPDNLVTYTDSVGNYIFHADTGLHTVSVFLQPGWSISSDSLSYTIDAQTGTYTNNDFGIKIPNAGSITCTLSGGLARCGTLAALYISSSQFNYSNVHSTIKLILDSAVIFQASNPASTSVSGDTIIWDLPGNTGYSSMNINAQVLLPSNMGYNYYTYLETTLFDSNNVVISVCTDTINQTIVCSFDPNDKAVSPEGIGSQHMTFLDETPTLDYYIRFQNTGTDTAFQVVILDELHTNFDINSFEFVASSHPVSVTILDHLVEFRFENILLPDSNVDEPGSNGFVRFRCNPILQPASYLLENTAYIYFDFNSAVVTNTVFNTITLSVGVDQLISSTKGILVYPNPFGNAATIKFSNANNDRCELSIYDITGRKVRSQVNSEDSFIVYKNELNSGMYFLSITNFDDPSVLQGKFIIK
ncbi:MAG: T9SS type A sorting domain-containing protein [Bacteroidetes bacterium]|nr:MAG: T9SS type A sorting domain-containing protein [Bacteroidota bacterium]